MENNLTQDYEKKPKQPILNEIFSWMKTIGITLVVAGLILTFVAQFVNINGQSMEDTYHHGDRVLICKLFTNYKQGDIIVATQILDEPIIKRVIATEGQVVDFDPSSQEVTVDGEVVPGSKFGLPNGETTVENVTGHMFDFPQTVPKNCVFVLGDNRMHSSDSRYKQIGMIPKNKILGKVVLNVYPFDKFGIVK